MEIPVDQESLGIKEALKQLEAFILNNKGADKFILLTKSSNESQGGRVVGTLFIGEDIMVQGETLSLCQTLINLGMAVKSHLKITGDETMENTPEVCEKLIKYGKEKARKEIQNKKPGLN